MVNAKRIVNKVLIFPFIELTRFLPKLQHFLKKLHKGSYIKATQLLQEVMSAGTSEI